MAGEKIMSGNARFTFGGKTIFHAMNCSISMNREFKERATKDTNGTQRAKSKTNWSGSGDALLTYGGDSIDTLDFYGLVEMHQDDSDTPLQFELVPDEVDANKKLTGECFIETLDPSLAVNEDGTLSFSIVGNGKFVIEAIPVA